MEWLIIYYLYNNVQEVYRICHIGMLNLPISFIFHFFRQNDILFWHHIDWLMAMTIMQLPPTDQIILFACAPDTRILYIYIFIYICIYMNFVFIMPICAIDRSRVCIYFYNIRKIILRILMYINVSMCIHWNLLVVCDLKITIPWIGNVLLKIEYDLVLESNIIIIIILSFGHSVGHRLGCLIFFSFQYAWRLLYTYIIGTYRYWKYSTARMHVYTSGRTYRMNKLIFLVWHNDLTYILLLF